MSRAVEATVPSCGGRWEEALFQFAVRLKALPHLAGLDADGTGWLARRWHEAAGAALEGVKPGEVVGALARAWPRVKHPHKRGPLEPMAERARRRPLNVETGHRRSSYAHLATLCHLLSLECGGGPFFLAGRTAAELLELKPRTAADWLRDMVKEGLLEVVEHPDRRKGKATVYRWTGPASPAARPVTAARLEP